MRMSILFRGTSMRRPPRVPNAVRTLEGLVANDLFQIAQLTLGAANLQPITVSGNGNSGGIVSAVLKLAESLDDYRDNALLTYISNNAAHNEETCSGRITAGLPGK
jgi:hypothetical protein